MTDVERLRDRAARVLALALKALEDGRADDSAKLTTLASEILTHAEEMERREATSIGTTVRIVTRSSGAGSLGKQISPVAQPESNLRSVGMVGFRPLEF
jgi:hypothetical protein